MNSYKEPENALHKESRSPQGVPHMVKICDSAKDDWYFTAANHIVCGETVPLNDLHRALSSRPRHHLPPQEEKK